MSGIGESGTNLAMSGGEQAAEPQSQDDTELRKISKWVAEITLYDREARTWQERVKKIQRRYKDERSAAENSVARFNALWSNVQTTLPALYARNPKPDIQRRFKDADPVGRVTSTILERSVAYFTDTDHFSATARECVLDYLLGGRGTVWCRYVPSFQKVPEEITDDATENEGEYGEEEAQEPPEIIDFEEALVDYVHADDFGHNICRTWEEVYCVWRKCYLSRKELIARFGEEKGKLPPLDYKQKDDRDNVIDNGVGKATIYELWDKERDCAVWFHKDIPEALDLRHDPLELEGFFPCPKPLYATLANDSLIPTPDYIEWQDQAVELDTLTGRIHSTIKSMKVAGAYDASAPAIGRILSEGIENQLIPVEQWAALTEKGGLAGVIAMLPTEGIANAVAAMYEAREKTKADLYEITGLSDIIRGSSDPNETATAQQIKSQFGSMRINDRQREVQRFIRQIIRIMVDMICNKFQLETIKTISGIRLFTDAEKMIYAPGSPLGHNGGPPLMGAANPPGPPAMQPPAQEPLPQGAATPSQLSNQPAQPSGPAAASPQPQQPSQPPLPKGMTPDQLETMLTDPSWEDVDKLIRNNALRSFRIDIETDSTIKADEESEKASRLEFIKTIGELVQQAENAPPDVLPFLFQVVMFAVRAFPVGKELEGSMNALIAKLEKAAAQPQPPKPDPAMAKVHADMQVAQAKGQADMELAQAKLQAETQLNQAKIQGDIQLEHAKLQAKQASDASEAQQAAVTISAKTNLRHSAKPQSCHRKNALPCRRLRPIPNLN